MERGHESSTWEAMSHPDRTTEVKGEKGPMTSITNGCFAGKPYFMGERARGIKQVIRREGE